jgi:hypothetical protein
MRRVPVLLAIVAASACGKIGPLKPPAPHGPLPPGGVDARQIGAAVEVGFTVPQPRGGAPGQEVARVEILRVAFPKGVIPAADPDAFRVRGERVAEVAGEMVKPGSRLVIADPALASLADGGLGWTLRYGVRVRDQNGRPSSLVVARDLMTLSAPEAPRGLTAQATADGVRLTWDAPPGTPAASYNVYRGPADGTLAEQPQNVKPVTSRDYLDAGVESGKHYRYVVRAVAAEGAPYREGISSAAVIVNASDVFPPASPTGLVAVQEGKAVRLLWNPGTERDLDGYRVYRRREGGEWTRLGADPLRQPTLLDSEVKAGDGVSYRVTAIDRATPPNESAPSAEAGLRVAEEPGPPAQP